MKARNNKLKRNLRSWKMLYYEMHIKVCIVRLHYVYLYSMGCKKEILHFFFQKNKTSQTKKKKYTPIKLNFFKNKRHWIINYYEILLLRIIEKEKVINMINIFNVKITKIFRSIRILYIYKFIFCISEMWIW